MTTDMGLRKIKSGHGHWYRLDGKKIDGVTTLIGEGIPKPFLVGWAAKSVAQYVADNQEAVWAMRTMDRESIVASLKGKPYSDRNAAAGRGTQVHDLAERLSRGDAVEVPPELKPWVDSLVEYFDTWEPQSVIRETPVANRRGNYGGTLDEVADFPAEKIWWKPRCAIEGCTHTRRILDYKTSKRAYAEVALQLSAYKNADLFSRNGEDRPFADLGIVCDEAFIVHVTPEAAEVHPVYVGPEVFRAFGYVAWVARMSSSKFNRDGQTPLDSWLGDPVQPVREGDIT